MGLFFYVFCSLMFVSLTETHKEEPKLLLISFDGFRWDYLDKADTPNFARIYKEGVRAKWIKNAYVTKTFPNHYTIISGLYEESHGIISNGMYDPILNETFLPQTASQRSIFFGGEPIWVTNQEQDCSHKTGAYFWIGSEDRIKEMRPTFYEKYNQSVPFQQRADTVIKWFTKEDVNLALLYWHEPDHSGHLFGPNSEKIKKIITECDQYMGYLLDKLEESKIIDNINIIVTSDHGMAETSPNKSIYLDDYISPDLYFTLDGSPYRHIWPKEGEMTNVYNQLKSIKHLRVYYKEEIPDIYHYKHNQRVAPIFIMCEFGWTILNKKPEQARKGQHGWNNSQPDMHPFFIARGPVFKRNYFSDPFNNIDIYPLLCHILRLTPAPNNGSLDNVMHILSSGKSMTSSQMVVMISTYIAIFIIAGGIAALFIIAVVSQYKHKPHHIVQINPLPGHIPKSLQESAGLLEDSEEDDLP